MLINNEPQIGRLHFMQAIIITKHYSISHKSKRTYAPIYSIFSHQFSHVIRPDTPLSSLSVLPVRGKNTAHNFSPETRPHPH